MVLQEHKLTSEEREYMAKLCEEHKQLLVRTMAIKPPSTLKAGMVSSFVLTVYAESLARGIACFAAKHPNQLKAVTDILESAGEVIVTTAFESLKKTMGNNDERE